MGNLTVVDINPFFGKIKFARFKKAPEDHVKEACERAILQVLFADKQSYPVDVVIIPRQGHIAEMEEGEGKREAQAQERIDIAAAIQKLLRNADR